MKHLSPEKQEAINDAVFALQKSLVEMELRGADPLLTTQIAELGRNLGNAIFINSTVDKLSITTQANIGGVLEVANLTLTSGFTLDTARAQTPIERPRYLRLLTGFRAIRETVIDVDPKVSNGLIVKRPVA